MNGNFPTFPSSQNLYQSNASLQQPLKHTDISTKRKILQHSLGEAEELYSIIFRNITEVFFIIEKTGLLLFVSPNIEQVLGYSKAEVQEDFEAITQLLGDNVLQEQNLENCDEILNIEQEIIDKFGQKRTLSINVKPVATGSDKLLYSCRDITSGKSVEPQLKPIIKESAVQGYDADSDLKWAACECHQGKVAHQSTEFKQTPEEFDRLSVAIPRESPLLPRWLLQVVAVESYPM